MRRNRKRSLLSAEILLSLVVVVLLVILGGFVWFQRDAIMAIVAGRGQQVEPASAPAPPRADAAPTVSSEAGPPPQSSTSGTDDIVRPSVPADVEADENAARAMLREEQASDGSIVSSTGTAVWRVERGNSGRERVTVDISVPDGSLDLGIVLYENENEALPASHLIEVRIRSSSSDVVEVGRPFLKESLQARSEGLIGAATKIEDGLFLIALSADSRDVGFNMDLLRSRPLIDLPMVYANKQRAILTIEEGEAGEQALRQVLGAGSGEQAGGQ